MKSNPTSGRSIAVTVLAIVLALVTSCSRPDDSQPDTKKRAEDGEVDRSKKLATALSALRAEKSSTDAKQRLGELEAYLRSLPPEAAADLLIAALDAGDDAALPLEFKIGDGGFLEGHPSWRVALLDWLGKFDPQAAAAYAEKILEQPTHPDEWAVALRNYARGNLNSESFGFLRSKAEEMIDQAEWRHEPSVGFLEAFDVFVYSGATESTPKLSSLVGDRSTEGKAAAHAAFLTLDRLTLAKPEEMFAALAGQDSLFESRGPMVANFYARADLRDANQRQQVESYLLDPRRTAEELTAFAGVYPNNNQMISKNLLTTPQTAKGAELVAHDRAALAIVETWLSDPKFQDPKVKPHVQTMHRRLAGFVRQAAGSNQAPGGK